MIVMQPSRNNPPHPHYHPRSSPRDPWRSTSSSFMLAEDDNEKDNDDEEPIVGCSAPSAEEEPLSLSASFLPPASAANSSSHRATAASVPHHLLRPHQQHRPRGFSMIDQVASAPSTGASADVHHLGGESALDVERRRQLQQQRQQQQHEQLFDLYELQQRRLDAEKLQLLHERQQAYLQQAQAAASYHDDDAGVAGGGRGGSHAQHPQPRGQSAATTLREALLPSILQQQQQQQQQQQPMSLRHRPFPTEEYLLARQGLPAYPTQPQATQYTSSYDQGSRWSYAGMDDGAAAEHRALSLLHRLPTNQWNQPAPAEPFARGAEWGERGNLMSHQGASDKGHYYDGRYAPRGWSGTGLSNLAPASDEEVDSGRIEPEMGAASIIRPVPSQIDFRAHKPGPNLESNLAESLLTGNSAAMEKTSANAAAFPSERANLEALRTRCETPAQATRVLRIVGSTLRSKADPFVDVTTLPFVPSTTSVMAAPPPSRANRSPSASSKPSSSNTSFPEILYDLLDMSDREQLDDIVSWLPHKRAFRINNKDRFMTEILPLYFKGQNRWSSFLRQLNLYGFSRVAKGTDYGAYYHELMIGGRPDLCQFMRRVGTPKGLDRRTYKLAEGDDPDFYAMPLVLGSLPMPAIQPHGRHPALAHGMRASMGSVPNHGDHRHSSYRGL